MRPIVLRCLAALLWALGSAAVGAQPARPPQFIILEGVVGGVRIPASLLRTGEKSWQWTEGNSRFQFRTVSESPSQIVIHDPSRDIYHTLDLASRRTAWRQGSAGAWNNHYAITRIEHPRQLQLE